MKDGPSFQFYAGDFLVDTNTWTVDELGVYIRLLASEWENGGLPNDSVRLARASGCSQKRFVKCWLTVSKKFHVNGIGNLINDRLELVREEQRKYRESQREKGKKRASKMWEGHIATAIATAQPVLQPEGYPVALPKDSPSSSLKDSVFGTPLPFGTPVASDKQEVLVASGSKKPDPIPYQEIIGYLNQVCGKNFSVTPEYRKSIRARWNGGKRFQDFKRVVDIKFSKWGCDDKMVDFLRPQTLFGTKMDSYLQEEIGCGSSKLSGLQSWADEIMEEEANGAEGQKGIPRVTGPGSKGV